MDEGGGGALPYSRALDGVRGLAVLAVLLFHAGVPLASGGFLGVSLFFTLSGYLITQLLLKEREATGRLSLRRFWGRRLRRLLPASLTCIVVVAVAARTSDLFPGGRVRGDLVAALADVANWRFALHDASYAELFTGAPSPVLHFWSLAIEEQFYLAFPVLVAALVALGGARRRTVLACAFGGLLAASALAAVVATSDDLAYYGTHTRAAELLAGALLALALPIGKEVGGRTGRALAVGGVVSLAAIAALVASASAGDRWVYSGALAAFSGLSVALLASAAVPGPVRRLCSWRPLVALGLISYGVYVYHWPLFLVLSAERTGLHDAPLFAVRLSVTLAVAAASFVLLEQPIRRRQVLHAPLRARPALIGALALIAGAVVAVPSAGVADADAAAGVSPPTDVVTFSTTGYEAAPPPPLRVLVLGSEPQIVRWFDTAWIGGRDIAARSAVRPGCPIRPTAAAGQCRSFEEAAADAIAVQRPDLVVVGVGAADRAAIAAEAPNTYDKPHGLRRTLGEESVVRAVGSADGLPVLFLDTVGGDDAVGGILREADLELRDVLDVTLRSPDPVRLGAAVTQALGVATPAALRVVVIGDSTSYGVAEAMDVAGAGQLEVVWAGRHNCAVVQIERLRWWPGAEWDKSDCPSVERVWPGVIAEMRPQVVLVVASLPELAEQRYPGVRGWHVAGDAAFTEAHDTAMAELQHLLAPTGALTLVATTPPITTGGFKGSQMGKPARLAAWNAQLARWDQAWASVGIIDWAAMLADAEAAHGGPLRPDGVHLRPGDLATIASERLLPAVRQQLDVLDAAARAVGCLAGADGFQHLSLETCRTP